MTAVNGTVSRWRILLRLAGGRVAVLVLTVDEDGEGKMEIESERISGSREELGELL